MAFSHSDVTKKVSEIDHMSIRDIAELLLSMEEEMEIRDQMIDDLKDELRGGVGN